jgi:phosphoglycerate dehydrogenase-like enzyme
LLLAPHAAWLTTGPFARNFVLAAENCRRLRDGAPLLHQVAWEGEHSDKPSLTDVQADH